jgi:hypothetical protein
MKHLSGVWAHIYIQEEIEGKKRKKREREKKGLTMLNGKKSIHPTFNHRGRIVLVFLTIDLNHSEPFH